VEPWRLKKKLTETEKFAFRLCLAVGVLHPDLLLPQLSWQQFNDWRIYESQEPWGESRADQRTMALAAWIKARAVWESELPGLIYPYFETGEDLLRQKAVLDKQVAEVKAKKANQRRDDTLAGG
jgi:hypothetical protein